MLGLTSMFVQPRASAAVSFGGSFNCDANAALWCGAPNTSTIINDYNKGNAHNSASSIQHIYSSFGITSSDIQSISTTAVAGSVTKSGDIYVGSKLVATGAWTAGREYISGSTTVTSDGTTFYRRPPSVSFLDNSLTAYVVMSNGQFKFAILSSCGNPVSATPMSSPKAALACRQLLLTPGTIESNGDQEYNFTASASATNGSIAKYVFNLGNGMTQTVSTSAASVKSNTETYAPGTYDVSVAVSGVAGNVYTAAPATVNCTGSFTVQPSGSLTCNTLTLNDISTDTTTGDVTYSLTAQATATRATIQKYVFTFGNGTTQTVTTNATTVTSQNVAYNAGQTYNSIYVTVYGVSNNTGSIITAGGANTGCATNLAVPVQTCTTGSTSSSCKPTCTASSGQTYPAGSSACAPTVTTTSTPPKALPNTGAGSIIGLFVGVSIAGAIGYRFFIARKLARDMNA